MKVIVFVIVMLCVLLGFVSTFIRTTNHAGTRNQVLNKEEFQENYPNKYTKPTIRILSTMQWATTTDNSIEYSTEHFPEYMDIYDVNFLNPDSASLVDLAFDESDEDLVLLQGQDSIEKIAKAYETKRIALNTDNYNAFNRISKTPHVMLPTKPVYMNMTRRLIPGFLQDMTNLRQLLKGEIGRILDTCQGGIVFLRFKPSIVFGDAGKWISSTRTLISHCHDSEAISVYLHSVRMNGQLFSSNPSDDTKCLVLNFVSRWLREATLCPILSTC